METLHKERKSVIDVGPVSRQLLTRADDFFGGPFVLTLGDELAWSQVSKGAVWPVVIVIHPPGFQYGLRLGERSELMHVQTLVTQPPIERLNKRIFHGFAGSNEVELDAPPIRPILESTGLEFRPMIDRDGARPLALSQDVIKYVTHQRSRHPKSGL